MQIVLCISLLKISINALVFSKLYCCSGFSPNASNKTWKLSVQAESHAKWLWNRVEMSPQNYCLVSKGLCRKFRRRCFPANVFSYILSNCRLEYMILLSQRVSCGYQKFHWKIQCIDTLCLGWYVRVYKCLESCASLLLSTVCNEKVYNWEIANKCSCFTRKRDLLKVLLSPRWNIILFAAVKLWYDSADHVKSSHENNTVFEQF